MMCYRDMTFCPFYENCAKASNCHRPLTPKVQEAAAQWAAKFIKDGDVPIAVFHEKPDCHEEAVDL